MKYLLHKAKIDGEILAAGDDILLMTATADIPKFQRVLALYYTAPQKEPTTYGLG